MDYVTGDHKQRKESQEKRSHLVKVLLVLLERKLNFNVGFEGSS